MILPAIITYQDKVKDFYNTDFEIQQLDATCTFSEGPVWHPDGFYLFSDIPENVVYKITETGKKEIYLNNSGCTHQERDDLGEQIGSNGLALNKEGDLLICQHGNHAVATFNGEKVDTIISEYNGKPFNSPNDIILHENGSIFFSDPPYGLKDKKLIPEKYQPVSGIYCWRDGKVQLISDHYRYPNGVCLSADKKILFTCSNKPFERFVLMFNTENLKFMGEFSKENGDGIKSDRHGNILLCSNDGILIVNKKGERLALIKLPTIPANICWGGVAANDLFITARENIYLITDLQKQ